jgi:DHA2 family methylenomycin A resistance protein-like MFS transporter
MKRMLDSTSWLLGFSSLLLPFDFICFNLALYPMQQVLHIPIYQLPWIMTSLLITFVFFAGLFFQAASFKQAKSLLVSGLAIYALSALFLLGHLSLTWIIIARLFQGVGAALILPSSLQLLKQKEPAHAYKIWAGVLLGALLVSPWLTGLIVKGFSIRWIFFFLAFYAAIMAIINAKFLHLEKTSDYILDKWGFLLIGSSMATLVVSLSVGMYWGWGLSSIFFFVAFLLFNFAFFAEEKSPYPLLEIQLFKDRSFFSAFIPLLFLQFVLWPILFFIPIYMQYFLGIPILSTGLWFMTFTGSVVLGSILGKTGYAKGYLRFNLSLSLLLITISLFLLSFVGEKGNKGYLLGILGILGLGWGILFLNIYSGGVGLFPKKLVTRGFAFTEIFPFFFGALGLAIGFNIFINNFNTIFYDCLGDANIIFPYNINDHFFEILNLHDLHGDIAQKCFKKGFLGGLHALTRFLSWIGIICLIFTIVFTPKVGQEVLSEKPTG